jgi:hypothetical protein
MDNCIAIFFSDSIKYLIISGSIVGRFNFNAIGDNENCIISGDFVFSCCNFPATLL